jgi:hypothetical protein
MYVLTCHPNLCDCDYATIRTYLYRVCNQLLLRLVDADLFVTDKTLSTPAALRFNGLRLIATTVYLVSLY